MNASRLNEIVAGIRSGDVVPYLGPSVLQGVVDSVDGSSIPADSDSLIYAMTGGHAMAPRLMYEFPRAAMHMENKKGRGFLDHFLNRVYGERNWKRSGFHEWLATLEPAYIIDSNRDTQLQQIYADRPHTLVVGVARIAGTPYRFDIYEFGDGEYRTVDQEHVNPALPVLFKILGTPLPKPSFIASDADFVDYITELMGGFAVPTWLKQYRQHKKYLFVGMRFVRDTERMVMSELVYGASDPVGWALIPDPTDKERRFCSRKRIELIEADWPELLAQPSLIQSQLTETSRHVTAKL